MPVQLLDIILVVLMAISGLLALMRGFTREVLSLLAWVVAAAAAWWAIQMPPLIEFAQQFIQQEKVATVVTGAAAFLVVLLVMSVISVKIGDWVLESAVGPFDRTLGGIYGLLRGLVLVTIAFLFYIWLVPINDRSEWVEAAKLKPLVIGTAEFLVGFMPGDIADTLGEKLAESRAWSAEGKEDAAAPEYGKGDRARLENLMREGTRQQP